MRRFSSSLAHREPRQIKLTINYFYRENILNGDFSGNPSYLGGLEKVELIHDPGLSRLLMATQTICCSNICMRTVLRALCKNGPFLMRERSEPWYHDLSD